MFLLQGMETLEDDTFTAGETVSNIGEVVTRITGIHMRVPHVFILRQWKSYWSSTQVTPYQTLGDISPPLMSVPTPLPVALVP
jgi:hypothetical protein